MRNIALDKSKYDREVEKARQFYQNLGYEVTIEPGISSLPEPLRNFRPDLVARRGNDCVVVEVKDKQKVRRLDYWQGFKNAVDNYPNYRLDLFVPDEEETAREASSSTPQAIGKVLDNADKLLRNNERNLALITAWIALEAVMRNKANSLGLSRDTQYSSSLLVAMYEDGELDPQQYTKLQESLSARNRIAHGRDLGAVPADLAQIAIDAARQLTEAA